MKKILYPILILLTLFLASCEKEEKPELQLPIDNEYEVTVSNFESFYKMFLDYTIND